jgi:hypothetical protein
MNMLVGQFRRKARRFSLPHHAAITAQQSCSINDDKNLVGRHGMSKTGTSKKCAETGTSQMRKRSLRGMPVPTRSGAFISMTKARRR